MTKRTGCASARPRPRPRTLREPSKPVFAVVHGTAHGGGSETAMSCGFTIASEDALFGQPEAAVAR